MTYAVVTQGLTKRYKNTLAVDNVNLSVPEGCCCGFLGKNGAGKTTTIKMLVGLNKPTSGQISIMGEKQIYGRQNTQPFGYLPDVPNFYGYMTGAEFLDLCGKLCEIPKAEREARIKSLLQQVGLEKTRTRIAGYSRGMKQRLGIAQAMINNPPVIFMDEPISALDPIGRRDVAEIIRSLKGTTVILSTHILTDVEFICDYVLIIEKGKILAQDYLSNLKQKYASDTAKVRFLQESDAAAFSQKALTAGFSVEQINPMELLLRTGENMGAEDTLDVSRAAAGLVHSHGLAFESLGNHTPTLEDIFYETIKN
ncbi:MAG: ABC transporter ATP-binding protein [Defluviitaleaceae bacterium]|nr:ABC transporter ATP-binding protein [Defluviitaleaceae bacterium]